MDDKYHRQCEACKEGDRSQHWQEGNALLSGQCGCGGDELKLANRRHQVNCDRRCDDDEHEDDSEESQQQIADLLFAELERHASTASWQALPHSNTPEILLLFLCYFDHRTFLVDPLDGF